MVAINAAAKRNRILASRTLRGWLFISPWLVGFLAFTLYPFFASLFYSFTNYDILTRPHWIGLENYASMIKDPLFWQSLYNTFYYAVIFVPLSTVLAIAIAMLLNMRVKAVGIYRAIFYLPSVVPVVASSVLWLWLFNPSYGLINALLNGLGIPGPGWIFSVAWSKPGLILMGLWGLGTPIVVYLASLQGVPSELYEAADIEGAKGWAKTWHITLPMISPAILFNVILGIIGAFQYFTQAYVMTSGGPDNSTLFYALYIYQEAFEFLRMGYASAMAWILFVIILLITLLVFKTSARRVYYGGDE
jgi:multiple sugar transport system permease protein